MWCQAPAQETRGSLEENSLGEYRSQCQVVKDKMVKAKSENCHNILSEADNHKNVYSTASSLLFGPKVQNFPSMTQCKTFLSSLQTILFQ